MMAWDGEWRHHLPFPFLSVLWFDIQTVETIDRERLIQPEVKDHSGELEKLVSTIGLDYEVGAGLIRIFGYSPKDHEGFE